MIYANENESNVIIVLPFATTFLMLEAQFLIY